MYLLQLADRVASGLRRLPPGRLELHRDFVMGKQTAEGGFPGREGGPDLYYTGFAVRALAVTGGLPDGCLEPLAGWLRQSNLLQLNAIDLLSWLYSALVVQASGGPDLLADQPSELPDQLIASLLTLRTADGGFAKSSEGALGSTYQSFLVALIFEILGRSVPRRNQLVQFLYDRQRDDGGFVEIAPMRRSGTNPTAAAVALLSMLKALDDDISADVAGFLSDVAGRRGISGEHPSAFCRWSLHFHWAAHGPESGFSRYPAPGTRPQLRRAAAGMEIRWFSWSLVGSAARC
ncbi:MAG UNVERIFIED_CONTAM: geranyl transferase [Planctomycetaceae bacterium]